MKKIATNHIACGMEPTPVGDIYHRCVRVSVRVGRTRVSRIDADVMTRKASNQLAVCCDRPFFNMRRQPVSIRQDEVRKLRLATLLAALRGADKTGDHRSECRG